VKQHIRKCFAQIEFQVLFLEVALTQSSTDHCFFEMFVMKPDALVSLPLFIKQYFEEQAPQW
jgi:hypothetical protein